MLAKYPSLGQLRDPRAEARPIVATQFRHIRPGLNCTKAHPFTHASEDFGEAQLMSRTGRVQLGLRRAAIVAPDREWSTRELMGWTHTMQLYRCQRSRRDRLNYCRSIRRAAERVAIRVGRRWPDGILWRLKPVP